MHFTCLWKPEQRRNQRRNQPETQTYLPAVADVLAQRHRRTGCNRSAQAQRHGVDTGHCPGLVREIALDDTGQQYADDPNARARQQAAGKQADFAEQAAYCQTRRQCQEHHQNHPFTAKTPGKNRCQWREQAQTQHRQGGQQTSFGSRHPKACGHLVKQRRNAG